MTGIRDQWPALPLQDWEDTCETLHLWTQIVGKVRLAATPWINHGWHTTLYVTARGLTTGPMPHGARSFQIDFDFLDHRLLIQASDGASDEIALEPCSVAEFYDRLMRRLEALDLGVRINPNPNEIPDAIPFTEDHAHAFYDAEAVGRFFQVLVRCERVFTRFRSGFLGKVSPVHFFWGSFDYAVTRFSGRPAPAHPGGFPGLPDAVTREAYSHEVSSAGFWPGAGLGEPAFYSYAYPEPDGFRAAKIEPAQAAWNDQLGQFILPYEAVRAAPDPDAALLAFLQSTYDAAADLAGWDRDALDCAPGQAGVVREV